MITFFIAQDSRDILLLKSLVKSKKKNPPLIVKVRSEGYFLYITDK